jgi:hypothetical protein
MKRFFTKKLLYVLAGATIAAPIALLVPAHAATTQPTPVLVTNNGSAPVPVTVLSGQAMVTSHLPQASTTRSLLFAGNDGQPDGTQTDNLHGQLASYIFISGDPGTYVSFKTTGGPVLTEFIGNNNDSITMPVVVKFASVTWSCNDGGLCHTYIFMAG